MPAFEGKEDSLISQPPSAEGAALDRIFRVMTMVVVLVAAASILLAPWKIGAGLLLGGLLSLLNYHWLRTSIAAGFSKAVASRPRLRLSRYILRYIVVAAVVFVAYKLNLVSLVATIAGLCTFVIALFVEALRESYFAIISREEAN